MLAGLRGERGGVAARVGARVEEHDAAVLACRRDLGQRVVGPRDRPVAARRRVRLHEQDRSLSVIVTVAMSLLAGAGSFVSLYLNVSLVGAGAAGGS